MTPLQIEKKVFGRSLRGYAPSEVDTFLKEIAAEMERLISRVRQLEAIEKEARDELDRFRAIENTMQEALILAQRTADETKVLAHREAEHVLAEARRRGEVMEREAIHRTEAVRADLERLRLDRDSLVVYLRSMVEGFATRLNDLAPSAAIVSMEAEHGRTAAAGEPPVES